MWAGHTCLLLVVQALSGQFAFSYTSELLLVVEISSEGSRGVKYSMEVGWLVFIRPVMVR